jgi:hypothetical protein
VSGNNLLRSSFKRRPRPDGKWSLAHPFREPARFIGQSLIAWPAAALAAIMMAAPKEGVEQLGIVLLALQITVLYPIIAITAIGMHFGLAKIGQSALSPLPLLIPIAIVGVWLATLGMFLLKYVGSFVGIL